ncbi:MAG: elongation factor Ts [Malacoplasma sp.]|nr:elongation factor Ts [Malacoplasma sp.]
MELVKKLRDMTGAGVMDAMKALKECNDDLEKAAQWLREKGIAKAAKKAGAIVTEGVAKAVALADYACAVEINCQTDFVANGDNFKELTNGIVSAISEFKPKSLDELLNCKYSQSEKVSDALTNLTAKIGEKIAVRRIAVLEKSATEGFATYEHFNGKVAVILQMSRADEKVGRTIAMHIAAMNPKFINRNAVDPAWIANETEVLKKQTLAEGKPADRVDMIVKGRINKSLAEVCLEDQVSITDPSKKIKDIASAAGIELISFARIEVGEGVEKKKEDFAAEVASQMTV